MWGDSPPGPVQLVAGRRAFYVGSVGGPGGAVIDGLEPAQIYRVSVTSPNSGRYEQRHRTLARPPGERLTSLATVSDLHIGAGRFGYRKTMADRSGHPEHFATRCARLALDEAVAWGAQLIVAKGDITNHGWHEQWARAADLLRAVPTPVTVTFGNHDTDRLREIDAVTAAKHAGLTFADPVHVVDLPGIRVITVDTSVDVHSSGTLGRALPDLLDALADADRPAMICLHHPFERSPIPRQYPRGIPWPESQRALRSIRRVARDVLITSGHTHRNRIHRRGSLVLTEVASTKDYPGVWAGYDVFEGGIIQTVRRTVDPAALSWTEYSRLALAGLWHHYAPGRLADRCLSHTWPSASPARTSR